MIDAAKQVATPKAVKSTQNALSARGAEVLATTNPYEVMRFRTCYGVGVIYRNSRGRVTANQEALQALEVLQGSGALTPGGRKRRPASTKRRRLLAQVMERDGADCFFCGLPMAPADAEGDEFRATLEHLVSITHGGPSHISNCFGAHHCCNLKADHLSAPEKIALRDQMRAEAAAQRAAA